MIGALASTEPRTRGTKRRAGTAALNPRQLQVGLWAGIALVAFGVRLLYILLVAPAPVGIGGDAGFYHSAANLIAEGRFYYREIFGHAYRTAEHPPLYPLVLSVSSLLGGDTILAHRILSCGIGAVAVVLVGLLARRLAGERAGLVAAAFAIFYPPFVTADGLVMSEPLFTLTVAAALLLAVSLRARPTVPRAALLGAMIGLAALTRAEALLLVPLLAWTASVARAPGTARRIIAATAASAILIAPWVIRNAIVFHRFTFSTNENTLIAGANCPDTYYGHDIGWWSLDCLAAGRTASQLDTGDASTRTALDYAKAHLDRVPLVMAVRVLRSFDLFQPLRQGNRELRRRWVDVVGLFVYFPMLALAAVGLVLAIRPRGRPRGAVLPENLILVLAPVWMVVITSALGWGIGRFRIAADISLIALAAYAVTARHRGIIGERPGSG